MSSQSISKLIEKAKKDPKFFHSLVFNPESVLAEIDLGREEKARLVAMDPEEFIDDLIGGKLQDCTVTVNCGSTCTHTVSAKRDLAQIVNPAVGGRIG